MLCSSPSCSFLILLYPSIQGKYIGITPSVRLCVCICSDNISRTAQLFLTKLVMVVYYYEVVCCAENLVHCSECQVHSKCSYNQNMTISIFSNLNCWSICNQPWFGSTASEAGVSCKKIGLLHSRSMSQQRFKMLVNVCPDDIFWTTKHFTKLGVFMLHYEAESHAEKRLHETTVFNVIVTLRANMINICRFLLYLLNCWSVWNQTWFGSTAS